MDIRHASLPAVPDVPLAPQESDAGGTPPLRLKQVPRIPRGARRSCLFLPCRPVCGNVQKPESRPGILIASRLVICPAKHASGAAAL